jgi:hypothetical protein
MRGRGGMGRKYIKVCKQAAVESLPHAVAIGLCANALSFTSLA